MEQSKLIEEMIDKIRDDFNLWDWIDVWEDEEWPYATRDEKYTKTDIKEHIQDYLADKIILDKNTLEEMIEKRELQKDFWTVWDLELFINDLQSLLTTQSTDDTN